MEAQLNKAEAALIQAFREISETGRVAAEWRTLGQFANAKARAEEEEYDVKFMKGADQLYLRIRFHDRSVVEQLRDRLRAVLERQNPPTPGVHHTWSDSAVWYGAFNELAYSLLLKGLEVTEQELGLEAK